MLCKLLCDTTMENGEMINYSTRSNYTYKQEFHIGWLWGGWWLARVILWGANDALLADCRCLYRSTQSIYCRRFNRLIGDMCPPDWSMSEDSRAYISAKSELQARIAYVRLLAAFACPPPASEFTLSFVMHTWITWEQARIHECAPPSPWSAHPCQSI